MPLPVPCPDPSDSLEIRWDDVAGEPWARAMAACVQDPEHHAEGDVWTHTRMACDALVALPAWQALPADEREAVFAATLLHDIAKPPTARVEDGRIRHPGHSSRGATTVRDLLWRAGAPAHLRERVARLVRHHHVPFHALDEADPRRRVAAVSQSARCDHLALVTRADTLGRVYRDLRRLLDSVALFEELCADHGCLDRPFAFPSDHSRFLYFRSEDRDPTYLAHDDTRCEVTVMCGLPGAGKDHWIAHNLDLPVVSLDALRDEQGAPPSGDQGAVVQAARDLAREHLRRAQSFVWNATSLTRDLRRRVIDLAADYHARVRIVFLDTAYKRLVRQNRERKATVPLHVIERMTRLWDPPDLTEAHRVDWIVQS